MEGGETNEGKVSGGWSTPGPTLQLIYGVLFVIIRRKEHIRGQNGFYSFLKQFYVVLSPLSFSPPKYKSPCFKIYSASSFRAVK